LHHRTVSSISGLYPLEASSTGEDFPGLRAPALEMHKLAVRDNHTYTKLRVLMGRVSSVERKASAYQNAFLGEGALEPSPKG
jgi:hypothetical protein